MYSTINTYDVDRSTTVDSNNVGEVVIRDFVFSRFNGATRTRGTGKRIRSCFTYGIIRKYRKRYSMR